jgi:hypothetical protein
VGTLFLATCYNPQIADGGLRCSATSTCPSGFKCSQAEGVCRKNGTITPPGGMGGVGGTGGMGGSAGDAGGATCTTPTGQYGPFPMCTPAADSMPCDLVCQSGCACNERCRLQGGSVSCVAQGPTFLQEYDSCVPTDDNCRPGAICLEESDKDHPACGAHCYRHCRDNSDCTNGSKCSVNVQFGTAAAPTTYTVCSPPADACNPYGAARCTAARTDRPYPTFACYVLSSSFPDIAICDCAGNVKTDSPCSYEHECEPGSECVAVPGQQRLCRHVCRVGVTGLPAIGGCPVGMTCTAFPRGTTFGYCH